MSITKQDVTIYLGSCGQTENSFATLPDAIKSTNGITISNTLKIVLALSELDQVWTNPMDLASFQLADTAQVTIELQNKNSGDQSSSPSLLQKIHTGFLLAGLQGIAEKKTDNNSYILSAQKKIVTSQPTSAAPIPLKRKDVNTAAITLDDDDMIDEDALLQEEEGNLAPDMKGTVVATKDGDDCAGREPCDNCTCGRKDAADEKKEEGGGEVKKPIKTSSCGKCGLGDAFRCPTCPYLGKPAFKPGEEHLVLDLQDDF